MIELLQAELLPRLITGVDLLFDVAETALEFDVGIAQRLFGVNLQMARQVDLGKEQVADLFPGIVQVILRQSLTQLGDLLFDLCLLYTSPSPRD